MLKRCLLSLCVLSACAAESDLSPTDQDPTDQSPDPAVSQTELSYHGDIKPLVDARCVSCHVADGVAPFALDTFEQVSALSVAIKSAVVDRRMPPWPADDACASYEHRLSLSDDEIDAIAEWVDGGAPEGDASLSAESLPISRAALPRIDHALQMHEAHFVEPPTGELDEHVCFLIDWPETERVFITGYEARPTNLTVAHHFVGTIVSPGQVAAYEAADAADPGYGWRCGAGGGMSGTGQLFATWVPGRGAAIFPDGTGLPIEPGSKILLNMHYNVVGGSGADQTEIDFMVEREVETPAVSILVSDPQWRVGQTMRIPAGDADVEHVYQRGTGPLGDVTIHSVGLHMHTLGAAGGLSIVRADGTEECLLDIPRWEFGWQLRYGLQESVTVTNGDQLRLWCRYDNSEANQPFVDGAPLPPRDVNWGDDTYDEMCLGILYLTR